MVVLYLWCFQGLTRTSLSLFAVVVEVTGHAHVLLAAFEKVNEFFFFPSVPVLVYVNISTGH